MATDTPAYVAASYAHLGQLDEARRHAEGYLGTFQKRITFGRPPRPGEAVAWLREINAFRRPEDLELLLQGIERAGLPVQGQRRSEKRRYPRVATSA